MSITIAPAPHGPFLTVTGDVRSTLMIPAQPSERFMDGELVDTYFISLSEGTLIQACYDERPEFRVVVEGAARVTVAPSGKEVAVDWGIEWINVASNRMGMALASKKPQSLPLLDLIDQAA
ncbi:MAG: hypothetical protein EOO83_00930 [Oxalobacteraceae bacterium]|nr:MAG: hypothetical protein EOO83_00930 [Oxalobacteraceae bacterium]